MAEALSSSNFQISGLLAQYGVMAKTCQQLSREIIKKDDNNVRGYKI